MATLASRPSPTIPGTTTPNHRPPRHLKRLSLSAASPQSLGLALNYDSPTRRSHTAAALALDTSSSALTSSPSSSADPFGPPSSATPTTASRPLGRSLSSSNRRARPSSILVSPTSTTPRTPLSSHSRRGSSIAYRKSLDDDDRVGGVAGTPTKSTGEGTDLTAGSAVVGRRSRPTSWASAAPGVAVVTEATVQEEETGRTEQGNGVPVESVGSFGPASLVEQHGDLLTFIAKKERKCLDLREELQRHESDLQTLKKKWQTIVSRSLLASASSNSSHTTVPPSAPASTQYFPNSHPSASKRHSLTNPSSPFMHDGIPYDATDASHNPADWEVGNIPNVAAAKKVGWGESEKGLLEFLNEGAAVGREAHAQVVAANGAASPVVPSKTGSPTELGVVVEEEEEHDSAAHARRSAASAVAVGTFSHQQKREDRDSLSSIATTRSSSVSSLGMGRASCSEESARASSEEGHDGGDFGGEKTPTPDNEHDHHEGVEGVDWWGPVKEAVVVPPTSTASVVTVVGGQGKRQMMNGAMKKHDRRRSTFDMFSTTAGSWGTGLGKRWGELANSETFKTSKRATMTFVEGFEKTLSDAITIDNRTPSSTASSSPSLLANSHEQDWSTLLSHDPAFSPPSSTSKMGVFARKARERNLLDGENEMDDGEGEQLDEPLGALAKPLTPAKSPTIARGGVGHGRSASAGVGVGSVSTKEEDEAWGW